MDDDEMMSYVAEQSSYLDKTQSVGKENGMKGIVLSVTLFDLYNMKHTLVLIL